MPGVSVSGAAVTFAGVAVVNANGVPGASVVLSCSPRYPAAGATPLQFPQSAPGSNAFLDRVTVVVLGIALVVL